MNAAWLRRLADAAESRGWSVLRIDMDDGRAVVWFSTGRGDRLAVMAQDIVGAIERIAPVRP